MLTQKRADSPEGILQERPLHSLLQLHDQIKQTLLANRPSRKFAMERAQHKSMNKSLPMLQIRSL